MTEEYVDESGMRLGPFDSTELWRIENSPAYEACGDGIKICECLALRNRYVLVLEAKSSSPQPKNRQEFEGFIDELVEKFSNSLLLFLSARRHRPDPSQIDVPQKLMELELAEIGFHLVLVINGHLKEWLPPLTDALRRKLTRLSRVWSNTQVFVLNEELAKQRRLLA